VPHVVHLVCQSPCQQWAVRAVAAVHRRHILVGLALHAMVMLGEGPVGRVLAQPEDLDVFTVVLGLDRAHREVTTCGAGPRPVRPGLAVRIRPLAHTGYVRCSPGHCDRFRAAAATFHSTGPGAATRASGGRAERPGPANHRPAVAATAPPQRGTARAGYHPATNDLMPVMLFPRRTPRTPADTACRPVARQGDATGASLLPIRAPRHRLVGVERHQREPGVDRVVPVTRQGRVGGVCRRHPAGRRPPACRGPHSGRPREGAIGMRGPPLRGPRTPPWRRIRTRVEA
jgi:hypothetical protein